MHVSHLTRVKDGCQPYFRLEMNMAAGRVATVEDGDEKQSKQSSSGFTKNKQMNKNTHTHTTFSHSCGYEIEAKCVNMWQDLSPAL